MAKGANLTITEFLTIAWAKLIATLKAHPFIRLYLHLFVLLKE